MHITFDAKDKDLVKYLVSEYDGDEADYLASLAFIEKALNQQQHIHDEVKSYFENKEFTQ